MAFVLFCLAVALLSNRQSRDRWCWHQYDVSSKYWCAV